MKGKAKFKVNGGNPVILCSQCSTIIKYSYDFTEEERAACRGQVKLGAQYCDECAEKRRQHKEKRS